MSIPSGNIDGVNLGLLQSQLLHGEISRSAFLEKAVGFGLSATAADEMADKSLAIATNQARLREGMRKSYDYIVIGSGASGSVVARRLAERPQTQVLLLEAGGEDLRSSVLMTENWFVNQGTDLDWSFRAEPSPTVNNRRIQQAMGKALGGGTSINGMVWARGHKNDFESWAKEAGDDGWAYEHILEIYRRIEDWHGVPDPARRGRGGEVFVQPVPDPSPLAPAFLKAAESLGYPVFDDQNGVLQEGSGGASYTNVRIRDGRRLNTPQSYLYPAMDRPNLTVLTGAFVNRVIIEERTATAVEFEWRGAVYRVAAEAEVILSAGSIQTPKLLMLSGVGDRAELGRFGISCVAHLPGVGRNFQDHPIIGGCLWDPPAAIAPRNNCAEANLFARSRPDLHTPDLHIFMIEAPYVSEMFATQATAEAWSICPGLARPHSRGYLRLRSADPRDTAEITANMLGDPRDLEALRHGVRISRELGRSAAMKSFVKREILPGDREGDALDQLIRDAAMSMHHPTSTAKMGRDELSVVDSKLRVYGVKNLRIADGSIMPTITTGNTQAPCFVIGERLGEILNGNSNKRIAQKADFVMAD